MLTKRPDREPDLTIRDVRIDADNLTIYYKLFYDKVQDREVDWTIPKNTTFIPPSGFEDNTSWAVWTEDISETKKKDYDWVFMEPMRDYLPPPSPLARKLKKKKVNEQISKVESELSILKSLFDGF